LEEIREAAGQTILEIMDKEDTEEEEGDTKAEEDMVDKEVINNPMAEARGPSKVKIIIMELVKITNTKTIFLKIINLNKFREVSTPT
jgi:hypothetical protein